MVEIMIARNHYEIDGSSGMLVFKSRAEAVQKIDGKEVFRIGAGERNVTGKHANNRYSVRTKILDRIDNFRNARQYGVVCALQMNVSQMQ